jgi:hypothetical protein
MVDWLILYLLSSVWLAIAYICYSPFYYFRYDHQEWLSAKEAHPYFAPIREAAGRGNNRGLKHGMGIGVYHEIDSMYNKEIFVWCATRLVSVSRRMRIQETIRCSIRAFGMTCWYVFSMWNA